MKNIDILILTSQVLKVALNLTIFILPLLILPFTANVLDFPKQAVFLFLVFLALIAYLTKALLTGVLEIKISYAYLPLLGLLIVVFFSSLFSSYPAGSFFGYPLKSAPAFLSLLGFVIFLFLIANTFEKKEEVFLSFLLLSVSAALTCLFGILQVFGKFLLPWGFAKIASFNTVGSVNALAVFAASILPLSLLFSLFSRRLFLKIAFLAVSLVFLTTIILANFWAVWLLVLLGAGVILVFQLYNFHQEKSKGWMFLPAFLMAFSMFFLLFKINFDFLPNPGLEVAPSFAHTFEIAKKTLAKSPLVGSGPGTFIYEFSEHRSQALNNTLFWNIRFGSGASEILERLATHGILGIVFLISLIVSLAFFGAKDLLKKGSELLAQNSKDRFEWLISLGVFSSFVVTSMAMFLYSGNLTNEFLFWLFGAFLLVESSSVFKTWQLSQNKVSGVFISGFFIVTLVAALAVFSFLIQRLTADYYYLQGITFVGENNFDKALEKISRALRLNPQADFYWKDLGQVALQKLNQEISKPFPSNENENQKQEREQQIQALFGLAVNSSRQATEISPRNVINWLNLGFVYSNLIGLAQGAFDFALKSYEEAQKLEPMNPVIPLEIARVYDLQATLFNQAEKDDEANSNWEKADNYLTKAVELKNDYWPAHFQKAVIFDKQGKLSEAIKKLEEIKPFNKRDASLAFQLGLYYWKDNNLKEAKAEFERAVQLSPTFANAKYFLGLIYDKEGNKEKAIKEFEEIASFSEENKKQVAPILENLRAGKPALGELKEPQEIPQLEEKSQKGTELEEIPKLKEVPQKEQKK